MVRLASRPEEPADPGQARRDEIFGRIWTRIGELNKGPDGGIRVWKVMGDLGALAGSMATDTIEAEAEEAARVWLELGAEDNGVSADDLLDPWEPPADYPDRAQENRSHLAELRPALEELAAVTPLGRAGVQDRLAYQAGWLARNFVDLDLPPCRGFGVFLAAFRAARSR